MKKLKLALLQTELVWENSQANLKSIGGQIEELTGQPDVIILPEMFNTGFTMEAEKNAETMDGKAVSWLKTTSEEKGIAICGSVIIVHEGRYFNRFLWAKNGEITTYYDKRHLFRMADEHHTFTPGRHRPEIFMKGWRIMPRVCYDLRFPVWSRSNKFDLQIYVANWPEARVDAWDKLLMARAIENQCYVVGVNRIGVDGKNIAYNGHSVVIDPKGNALTPPKNEKAGWISVELDLEILEDFRRKFPVFMDSDLFDLEV